VRLSKQSVLLITTLLAGITGAAVAPAAAVAAPGPTVSTLPFGNPADVVAAGDRVFVSGGRNATQIAVADATGAITGTIDGLTGPGDLQLSNDRRTLYVALPEAGQIAAYDTGSLTRSATYEIGDGTCPTSLAFTGRYVWFGYGCNGWEGNIGKVDLGRQPAVVTKGLADTDFYYAPLLASAVRNTKVLLAGDSGSSPSIDMAYAVDAGGTLRRISATTWDNAGSNGQDLALDPTGVTAFVASGAPYHVQAYPIADMSQTGTAYQTGAYPSAVDVTRDGTRIAGGAFAWYDPDVFVFNADGTVVTQFELGGQDHTLATSGLAWAPNGRRLYAISNDGYLNTTPAQLHVLPVPAA
jgi:sugar lactone lactonase YvrE